MYLLNSNLTLCLWYVSQSWSWPCSRIGTTTFKATNMEKSTRMRRNALISMKKQTHRNSWRKMKWMTHNKKGGSDDGWRNTLLLDSAYELSVSMYSLVLLSVQSSSESSVLPPPLCSRRSRWSVPPGWCAWRISAAPCFSYLVRLVSSGARWNWELAAKPRVKFRQIWVFNAKFLKNKGF